jgi:fermentation-respiration switch protein FrsA (DUF1100 family)
MQRNLIYITNTPHYNITMFSKAFKGLREIKINSSEALEISGWYIPPKEPNKPVVVLFHGNASNLSIAMGHAPYFTNKGYGFLIAEYRGYSGNPGKPTEEGLYEDARSWFKFLVEKEGIKEERIILFGNSLGSGVAVQLATENPNIKALILFSPFTSLINVAKKHYPIFPIKYLMHDVFDNYFKIHKVKQALLIVHGDKDSIVPVEQGVKLFKKANERKILAIIEGADHNDLYIKGADSHLSQFLETLEK